MTNSTINKNVPELRFSEFEGEWVKKKLGDVFHINAGGDIDKKHVKFVKDEIFKYPIYANAEANKGLYGYSNIFKIEPNENQNRVKYGDILFTTSSETLDEVSTASVLLDDIEEVYLNSFCFGFRPYSLDELVPEFAQFLFRSENLRKKIIKLAQGSTRYNMSKNELLKLIIFLPTKAEQQKIASYLSAIDKQIEQVARQIEHSNQWKKGFLQNIFV